MKRVFRVLSLFVMVGALASLTACKKDNASSIIGKWSFEKADIELSTDDAEIQAWFDEYMDEFMEELNDEFKGIVFEFKEDNTCIVSYPADEDDEAFSYTTEYSVEGDILTLDGDDVTIKTLNNKKLVLEMVDEDDDYSLVETLEFKRM